MRPVLRTLILGWAGLLERSSVREGVLVVTPNETDADCGKAPVPNCVEGVCGGSDGAEAVKGYAGALE